MDASSRSQFESAMSEARAGLSAGETPAARRLLAAAHRLGQNDPLPHARVHALWLQVEFADRRPVGLVNQAQLTLLAPAGSLARRYRGLSAGKDDGIGLVGTGKLMVKRAIQRALGRPRASRA